jgi:hypothetical protein
MTSSHHILPGGSAAGDATSIRDQAAEALAKSARRTAALEAAIEEVKAERKDLPETDWSKPQTATRPRRAQRHVTAPTPINVELVEVEAAIEVFEKKLNRKTKPLGWARRQAMKQQVAELKARRSLLKKKKAS